MPIERCTENGKPGFRFGPTGKCFTHDGTEKSRQEAMRKANAQAAAIKASEDAERKRQGKIS